MLLWYYYYFPSDLNVTMTLGAAPPLTLCPPWKQLSTLRGPSFKPNWTPIVLVINADFTEDFLGKSGWWYCIPHSRKNLSISVVFPKLLFNTSNLMSPPSPNILPPLSVATPATWIQPLWDWSSLEGRETRGQVTFSLLTFRMLMNRKCYLLLMSTNKCECCIPTAPGWPQPTKLIRGREGVTFCGQGCARADSHQLTSANCAHLFPAPLSAMSHR